MHSITPFLWFDDNAEEAVDFYTSVFKDTEVLEVSRYPENSPGTPGAVMTIGFRLNGQEFIALNGGPVFSFNPSVSFVIGGIENQEEVDYYWEKLIDGGQESQCGWLTDRFGLSWQVVPKVLIELLKDEDKEKSGRVMQAMLQMRKIDIAALKRAYAG